MSSPSQYPLHGSRHRKSGPAACSTGCAVGVLVVLCIVLSGANLNLRSSYGLAQDKLSSSQMSLLELREGIRNLNLGGELLVSSRKTLVIPPDRGRGESEAGNGRFQERGLAAFMFVQFSVHQISGTAFAVLGLAPGIMQNVSRNVVDGCEWEYPGAAGAGAPARLQAKVKRYGHVWFGETYRLAYSPLVVHCQFSEPVDGSGSGGKLFLNVSTFSPLEGDYIRVEALAMAASAAPGPDAGTSSQFQPPFKFRYAVCSPPLYGNVSSRIVRQWLAYHFALFQGEVHFFMYDAGGVGAQVRTVFRSYMDDGLLSVVDLREGRSYQGWYNHQVLGINDCFHRSRALATWALHFDLDEYLLPHPPHTLSSILEEYRDMPWVTFGSMPHRTELCALQELEPGGGGGGDSVEREHWEIDKAALRRWRPECWHPKDGDWVCLGAHGRRKYAANPRKVMNGGIHRVLAPEQGGVNVHPSVAAFHHYRGTLDSGKETCSMGQFRVSTVRKWQAAMEESRLGASVPMPGVEEEAWKTEVPDTVDEAMLLQSRIAKTFASHHLIASADVDAV